MNVRSHILLFLVLANVSCSEPRTPLIQRTSHFKISECKRDCDNEKIGVIHNSALNGQLKIRLGYIVNCSWQHGYLTDLQMRGDTLTLLLDRPHRIDIIDETTEEILYPIADCDCFFYLDLHIKEVKKAPEVIRINPEERPINFLEGNDREIVEIEEIPELNK
ncbi:MAG: hypothetical protein AAFP76_03450 [Bacteroidota bacterium]